jgi:murein L,D-transpeptidase YafK
MMIWDSGMRVMLHRFIFLVFGSFSLLVADGFLDQQKQYPRVRESIARKLDTVKSCFNKKNVEFPPEQIFIRIFKLEKRLELWARSSTADTFLHIKTYPFCASSGTLGPKRKQGDLQIPEGFYFIDRFNPFSRFYLSLGLNYPNASDRILSDKNRPGGDIFIHGDCVTIGCVPITDDGIRELYITALFTRQNGSKQIPVHIFPTKLTEENFNKINSLFERKYNDFWKTLQNGYRFFELTKRVPDISVDSTTGMYLIETY